MWLHQLGEDQMPGSISPFAHGVSISHPPAGRDWPRELAHKLFLQLLFVFAILETLQFF